jgi:hypothetical protein
VIRAVVDTNVFVSALISPSGNEALILLAIRHGLVKPYFSAEILQEYVEVLARPKFRFPSDEIEGTNRIAAKPRRGGPGSPPDPFWFAGSRGREIPGVCQSRKWSTSL